MSGAIHTYQGYQRCFSNTTYVTESPPTGLGHNRHGKGTPEVRQGHNIYVWETTDVWGALNMCQGHKILNRDTSALFETLETCQGHQRRIWDTMDIPRTIETYQGHKRHAWHTSQKLGVCQPGIQFVNCKGLSHRHLRLVWHTRDLSGTPETYLGHHGYATDSRDVSGIQETCLTHQPGIQFVNCEGLSWAKLSFDWRK